MQIPGMVHSPLISERRPISGGCGRLPQASHCHAHQSQKQLYIPGRSQFSELAVPGCIMDSQGFPQLRLSECLILLFFLIRLHTLHFLIFLILYFGSYFGLKGSTHQSIPLTPRPVNLIILSFSISLLPKVLRGLAIMLDGPPFQNAMIVAIPSSIWFCYPYLKQLYVTLKFDMTTHT
jgi:hypothetical protein